MIGSFLDCSGFLANSQLDEASRDPRASETTRQLVSALSGLRKSRGKAVEHVLSASIMLDANIKLIRRNLVLKASSLPESLAKEVYHLPLDPAGSGLFGTGLVSIREKGDKLVDETWSRALHEVAVRSVKTGKPAGQHRPKQATPGSGSKKGQQQKKKKPYAKKGGQPSKHNAPSTKGGGKMDSQP